MLKEKFKFLTTGVAKSTVFNKEINAEEEVQKPYSSDDFYSDIKDMIKKSKLQTFFECFYKLFYDEKIVNVQKRVFVFKNLVDDGIITLDQFLTEFNKFLL